MKRFLASLFIIMFTSTNVYAASLCDATELSSLRQKVANVNVNYEIVKKEVVYDDGIAINKNIQINIHNIFEDFYATLKTDGYQKRIDYADTDNGTFIIDWTEIDEIATFTLEVYTSNKTGCPNEKIKTIHFTTPKYNYFSSLKFCYDNPDFALCKEFITSDISANSFYNQVDSFLKEKEKTNQPNEKEDVFTKVIKFIDSNKWYFVGGAVIAVGVAGVILLSKKKKQKELGL